MLLWPESGFDRRIQQKIIKSRQDNNGKGAGESVHVHFSCNVDTFRGTSLLVLGLQESLYCLTCEFTIPGYHPVCLIILCLAHFFSTAVFSFMIICSSAHTRGSLLQCLCIIKLIYFLLLKLNEVTIKQENFYTPDGFLLLSF